VYEDEQGLTKLAYDLLSNLVGDYHNPALTAAASVVDAKLDVLVTLAAG